MSTETTIKPSKNGKAEHAPSIQELNDRIRLLQLKNEELEKEQRTHQQTLEQAVDSIIIIDSDKKITFYNEAAEQMFGYTRSEAVGREVKTIIPSMHGFFQDSFSENGNGIVANKPIRVVHELEMTRKSGSRFWGHLSLSKVVDDRGEVQYTAFIKDITRERASRAEAEGLLTAMNANSALVEYDLDGNVKAANKTFLESMGYSLDEIIGKNDRIFIRPQESTQHANLWSVLRSGDATMDEFRRLTKDGDDVWFIGTYTPVKDTSGEIIKVICLFNDITEQKMKLNDYIGQIEAINKSSAVIEFNMDGTIIKANDNFLGTVGYRSDEVEGMHHRIFCDPIYAKSTEYKKFWEQLNEAQYVTGEFERTTKSGDKIWLQAAYNPILDIDGKPYKVVKFATDVTAQKRAMKELNRVVNIVMEDGDLNVRANFQDATGIELELLQSINNLLEGIAIPVLEVSKVISNLADGDLTTEVSVECQGDIKKMADSLSVAMSNLNELMSDIENNSNLIAANSDQMLIKSDQMQGTTSQVATAIGQMAEGVHDQASQIDESYRLIELVRNSAENVGTQAESINNAASKGQENAKKGLDTVRKVVESMTQIQGSAGVTSESIAVLTKRSEEIAKTLNVITDIAWQTNLLALNAAIEAARAGDAGRGFAVVAEEIRKLAEDSRTSAGDIESVIKAVAQDISQAGKAISEMSESVKTGNQATKEAESVFVEIDNSVVETLDFSKEVLKATEIQKSSIDETVSNIEKIVVVAEQTSSGTEEIATSAKDLSNGMMEFNSSSKGLADIANDLRAGVSKFRLKTK